MDDASGGATDEEILDDDNSNKLYTLSGDEAEEKEDVDNEASNAASTADCNPGSGTALIQLPPCSVAGDNGLNDLLNPSMYEGGAPNVLPLQPLKHFHKVKEVEQGSMDAAEIVTDLDDPPPKTAPSEDQLPLSQIVEGSDAPKQEEESASLAESPLEFATFSK